jgi:hypothetical protein
MIFRSLCAFIWFKNIEKMLLQMTSGFLQLESTISFFKHGLNFLDQVGILTFISFASGVKENVIAVK